MADFHFVTDRLAVGNVASRATPGFCAVVSILATQPWDEVTGAPEVPNGREVSAIEISTGYSSTCVLHIDIADGETRRVCPDNGETYGSDLDSFLDDATSAHIRPLSVTHGARPRLSASLPSVSRSAPWLALHVPVRSAPLRLRSRRWHRPPPIKAGAVGPS